MTKEITKARIIQEIEEKFKLRELIPETFAFSETVIPTYPVRSHLERPRTNYKEVSIAAATAYTFFAVPETERWSLLTYNVVFMAAGAYTVSGVYIARTNRVGAAFIYLDMKEGQAVSYAVNLPNPVRLDPGDELTLLVDGYTSTAALRLYIDYIVEEIR